MRKLFLLIIVTIIAPLLWGCGANRNNSASGVVKPKYHHRWYDAKKDKRTKRVRLVRMN